MENRTNEIKEIISKVLESEDVKNIDERADLSEAGMDSLNFIEVLIALEEYYEVTIPEEFFGVHKMHSVYDISKLLEEADEYSEV